MILNPNGEQPKPQPTKSQMLAEGKIKPETVLIQVGEYLSSVLQQIETAAAQGKMHPAAVVRPAQQKIVTLRANQKMAELAGVVIDPQACLDARNALVVFKQKLEHQPDQEQCNCRSCMKARLENQKGD